MKIIARDRRKGKTTDLIKESALTGNYILVSNHTEAQVIFQLAHQMKLSIPLPVTIRELSLPKNQGTSIRRDGILVDNAERVLQQLLGIKINTLTISINEEEDE